MKKIFVALSTFGTHGNEPLSLIKGSGFSYTINPLKRRVTKDEITEFAKEYDGIIAGVEPYDAVVLEKLPNLSCISRCGSGIDNIDVSYAKKKGITILNTPNVVIQPVVELTVGMIFDLLRRITLHTLLMKSGEWRKVTGNLLQGKNVGIIGLGRIGKKVAETLLFLGAQVYGSDMHPDYEWLKKYPVTILPLEDLLKKVDVLSLHLTHISDNPFVLGEKEIRIMKPGAFIINVSRGQFIDEQALYNAVKDGHIGGVALDVFSEEPYKGNLCSLENVVLTPHIATLTYESRLQMEIEATKNIIEFFKKQTSKEEK